MLEIITDRPVGDAELRLKLNPAGAKELEESLRYARDSGHDHLMTQAWGGWWELSVEPGREAFTYNMATLRYEGARPPAEVSMDALVSAAADESGGPLLAIEASSPVGDATLEIDFDDNGLERLLKGVADAVQFGEGRVTLDQPEGAEVRAARYAELLVSFTHHVRPEPVAPEPARRAATPARKPGPSVAALQAWGFGLLLLAAVLILVWSRLG